MTLSPEVLKYLWSPLLTPKSFPNPSTRFKRVERRTTHSKTPSPLHRCPVSLPERPREDLGGEHEIGFIGPQLDEL